MAFGLHPLVALAAALGGLTVLAVAGYVVSRRWRPDGELTAVLADATETYGAFVVIAVVIAVCFWLALKLNLRADVSVIFGVIVAFPLSIAFIKWVLPLVPGFKPSSRRRRSG
jgi:hypothetical protein